MNLETLYWLRIKKLKQIYLAAFKNSLLSKWYHILVGVFWSIFIMTAETYLLFRLFFSMVLSLLQMFKILLKLKFKLRKIDNNNNIKKSQLLFGEHGLVLFVENLVRYQLQITENFLNLNNKYFFNLNEFIYLFIYLSKIFNTNLSWAFFHDVDAIGRVDYISISITDI